MVRLPGARHYYGDAGGCSVFSLPVAGDTFPLGQSVVVGHNPATERKFLRRFPGHGFGPWLDTLALGRMCVPGLADYSLSSLCGALGLTCSVEALLPSRRWHDALYDALASLLIVRFLVKELNLSGQPLEVLGKAVRT